jgi:2',3'-cyclic-nucleotide 2'-phosphodiesterase (5'-nucleotidase family)
MKLNIGYFFIGASLMACSTYLEPTLSVQSIVVSQDTAASALASVLAPYQDSLHREFDQVIAETPQDLIVQRPSSNLMNWCADAVYESQIHSTERTEPVICLLNKGGIRASFGAGSLSLSDFYKLMPFDNRLVWVKFPVWKIPEIEAYLLKSGGEPMSNCTFTSTHLQIKGLTPEMEYIWVLTSDFLATGGDQMTFFINTEQIPTNILLRDIFIEQAKHQGELLLDQKPRYLK